MQAGNKAAAVDLLAAAGPVAEADDVGAALDEAAIKGDAFGVIGEGHESGFAVAVVAHENGELAAGP